MSGKKGKKTKGKTIPLQAFLGDTPTVVTKTKSWADCTEDDDDYGGYTTRNKEPIVLPTEPRAARDFSVNEENIPTHGPFSAYISNISYDVEEDDLAEFFQDMKIASMRLPKESSSKSKGYGYIEFEDRQSLIDALNLLDTDLKGRRMRIELSTSSNDERRSRMGRMNDRRDYDDDPERTSGDWRSARAPVDNDDGGGGGGREDRYRSRGYERREDNRDSGFEDNKPGCWRDAPREAASSENRPRVSFRDNRVTGDERGERDWNRGDRGGGSGSGSGFGQRRFFGEDADKDKDRWRGSRTPAREYEAPSPSAASSEPPRERPKLNLKPPSKPKDKESTEETPSNNASSTPATNIFGAAKPVDTATREREIEERLAKSAEARSRDDDTDRRGRREGGAWGRRNGDNPEDREREKPAWRSNEDRENFDRSRGRQPFPRADRDREVRDTPAWRGSKDIRESRESRESSVDSRGTSAARAPTLPSRGPPKQIETRVTPDAAEKPRKELTEEEEIERMPKAKDDQAPNFVASNKYYMLPDDVEPDNIEE